MNSFPNKKVYSYIYFSLMLFSAIIMSAIFAISVADIAFVYKLSGTIFLVAVFFISNLFLYRYQTEPNQNSKSVQTVFNQAVDEKLFALEEATEYFGSTLNSKDMFRLLAHRISEIIPFTTCVLYTLDNETKTCLKANLISGQYQNDFEKCSFGLRDGLPGNIFSNKIALLDNDLTFEQKKLSKVLLKSGLGVPLWRGDEIYGVLVLYNQVSYQDDSLNLIKSIGSRVENAFQSSFNVEKNLANALTDTLTSLPNERAFYLVLLQQIAESQRFQEMRPLTVLSIDVMNFDEINQKYGHAVGDQVLNWISKLIKNQLRQMDFLARIIGDEFLVILPTANESVTQKIIQRINFTIENNPFVFLEDTKINVKLNFGSATYTINIDSPQSLVKSAIENKTLANLPLSSSVIQFPNQISQMNM